VRLCGDYSPVMDFDNESGRDTMDHNISYLIAASSEEVHALIELVRLASKSYTIEGSKGNFQTFALGASTCFDAPVGPVRHCFRYVQIRFTPFDSVAHSETRLDS
jgi:hypothetical protein